ncbi:conserved membrane hypothetical protein [Candidatus Magnetomoraceae bacterium gMMP-13]
MHTDNFSEIFLNFFAHLLIIAGILSMFYFLLNLVMLKNEQRRSSKREKEKAIRAFSMCIGFLIYFTSRLSGMPIPELILSSLKITNPFSFFLLGIIFPSLTGSFAAWYFIKIMKKGEDIASRAVILLATIMFFLFIDVYTSSFKIEDKIVLIPNATFVIGVGLYVIFKVR